MKFFAGGNNEKASSLELPILATKLMIQRTRSIEYYILTGNKYNP